MENRGGLPTFFALLGVLDVLQLVVVLAMVLGIGPRSRVFAVRSAVFGTKLDALRQRYPDGVPCLVFSGASRMPLIVRVLKVPAVVFNACVA